MNSICQIFEYLPLATFIISEGKVIFVNKEFISFFALNQYNENEFNEILSNCIEIPNSTNFSERSHLNKVIEEEKYTSLFEFCQCLQSLNTKKKFKYKKGNKDLEI